MKNNETENTPMSDETENTSSKFVTDGYKIKWNGVLGENSETKNLFVGNTPTPLADALRKHLAEVGDEGFKKEWDEIVRNNPNSENQMTVSELITSFNLN
jgi:hypothetical protein